MTDPIDGEPQPSKSPPAVPRKEAPPVIRQEPQDSPERTPLPTPADRGVARTPPGGVVVERDEDDDEEEVVVYEEQAIVSPHRHGRDRSSDRASRRHRRDPSEPSSTSSHSRR
jgi:hypothetical protein